MAKFYGHFAAAYGTMVLVLMVLSILTRSHIDAGEFGYIGFPILAFLYALIRHGQATSLALQNRVAELERRRSDEPGKF